MKKLLIAVGVYLATGAAFAWWLSSRGEKDETGGLGIIASVLLWPVGLVKLLIGKAPTDEGVATDAEKDAKKPGASLVVKTDAEKAADAKAAADKAAADKSAADKIDADKAAATKAAADAKPTGGTLTDKAPDATEREVKRWDAGRKHHARN